MQTSSLKKVSCFSFVLFLSFLFWVPSSSAQLIAKSGKNWKVNFNVNGIYADNLAQNPRGGTRRLFTQDSDSAFNWTGGAEYKHTFNDQWSLKAEYQIDMTVYSELGQYDSTNNSFGLKPRYKLGSTAFIDFQYLYIWSHAGGNSFSGVNYLGPSYTRSLGKWGLFSVRAFYANIDNFRNQARDADEFGGAFDYHYIFTGTSNYVGVGYQVSDQDTAGRFDRTTQDFKVKGRFQLPHELQFNAQYKFSLREYDTFASSRGSVREDNQHNYRLGLSRVLMDQWQFLHGITANVNWSRQTNFSNLFFREFTSNTVMGGLSASF